MSELVLIFAFVFSSAAWCGAPASQDMTFKDHGKVVKILTIQELKQIAPPESVRVFDPNQGKEVEFQALPLKAILNKVYGELWKKSEELLFTCRDGYQPSLPLQRFQDFDSLLAFELKGSKAFTIHNVTESNRKTNLAPYYLIWNNLKSPDLQTGDGAFWPYQLVGIDLIQFVDHFPKLAPPESSSENVRSGFLHFRKYCLQCHALNGDGGHTGPELNYPVNVTEYYNEALLKKWIADPSSIRWKTPMPALKKNMKDQDQVIEQIVAYLKAMKSKKIQPAR